MAFPAATDAEMDAVLALWTGFLPALNAAYGAEHVNQSRTRQDIRNGAGAGEEFWLSDLRDAYFAMRPNALPDGRAAWEFFEACFKTTLTNIRWNAVSKEMLLAVRDRGLALGYRWCFCRTSPLLEARSKTRLAAAQVSASVDRDGKDLRIFDLTAFAVA